MPSVSLTLVFPFRFYVAAYLKTHKTQPNEPNRNSILNTSDGFPEYSRRCPEVEWASGGIYIASLAEEGKKLDFVSEKVNGEICK